MLRFFMCPKFYFLCGFKISAFIALLLISVIASAGNVPCCGGNNVTDDDSDDNGNDNNLVQPIVDVPLLPNALYLNEQVIRDNLMPCCDAINSQLQNLRGLSLDNVNILMPGRSMPLIQAAMEILYPQRSIITFPLSGFRGNLNGIQGAIFNHFQQFIGAQNLGNRPTVIIDYSNTGQSVANLANYIHQWLVNINAQNQHVIALGLGVAANTQPGPHLNQIDFIPISLGVDLEVLLFNEVFEAVSPNIHFDLRDPPSNYANRLIEKATMYRHFKENFVQQIVKGLALRRPGRYELDPTCRPSGFNFKPDDDEPDLCGGGSSRSIGLGGLGSGLRRIGNNNNLQAY